MDSTAILSATIPAVLAFIGTTAALIIQRRSAAERARQRARTEDVAREQSTTREVIDGWRNMVKFQGTQIESLLRRLDATEVKLAASEAQRAKCEADQVVLRARLDRLETS